MAAKRGPSSARQRAERAGHPTTRIVDWGNFMMGAVSGALLIALLVLGHMSFQRLEAMPYQDFFQPEPPSQGDVAPPQSGLQLVVKNNEKTTVRIISIRGGNFTGNDTKIPPSGTGAFNAGCSNHSSVCEIVLSYLVYPDGNASSGGSQTGQGGGEGGNGSGGSVTYVPLSISTSYIGSATQDASYSFALEAIGGTGLYTWSVTGLPGGLAVSYNGLISGAPLEKGDFTLGIIATDGTSADFAELQLVVR